MILGFFRGGGRGKWVGVAEHTLAYPHVMFEHDTRDWGIKNGTHVYAF